MQSRDDRLTVFANDILLHDHRNPIVEARLARFDTVHTKATRQTCDTTENSFKCLDLMVRNEILKHLYRCDPAL